MAVKVILQTRTVLCRESASVLLNEKKPSRPKPRPKFSTRDRPRPKVWPPWARFTKYLTTYRKIIVLYFVNRSRDRNTCHETEPKRLSQERNQNSGPQVEVETEILDSRPSRNVYLETETETLSSLVSAGFCRAVVRPMSERATCQTDGDHDVLYSMMNWPTGE